MPVYLIPIIIVALFESLVEPEHLVKITNITVFMASPFLLFAWLMFMKMCREIAGKKTGISFIALFISFNFLLVPGIGYFVTLFTTVEIMALIKYGFIIISILYTIMGSYTLLSARKKNYRMRYTDIKNISSGIILIVFLQHVVLLFFENNIYLTLAFIVLFYVFGGFLPVYLRYHTDLSKLLIPGESTLSFDLFCEKFEISKREKEVIHEVCNGLSNQEIADKLFISLQTVKDHTHRIYGKTSCNSRTQLINLVNENH